MEFNICMPVRMICGENCVINNSQLLRRLGQKCLIATGGSSAEKSGALKDTVEALRREGIEYKIFNDIKENPLCSTVIEGGRIAREFGADFIIGIGGGSPLDASKAIAICAENPEFDIDGLYNRKIPAKRLPLVLIGTTSGTGSEVTGVSVLTNDKTTEKKSISGEDCYAVISFLDGKYTYSMPYGVSASTALDAFAHAVEGWFSDKCGELASSYGKLCLPVIFEGLKYMQSKKELPEKELRDKLYLASIYAGLQLNICGAAFPHTIGYALTENFNIPHGKACTAFMPFFLKRAKEFMPERYADLLKAADCDGNELFSVVKELTDVRIKATDDEILNICKRWENGNKNFNNSPGGFDSRLAFEAFSSLKEE